VARRKTISRYLKLSYALTEDNKKIGPATVTRRRPVFFPVLLDEPCILSLFSEPSICSSLRLSSRDTQEKVTLHSTTYPLDAVNDAMADLNG
jgi:hypothetical protein